MNYEEFMKQFDELFRKVFMVEDTGKAKAAPSPTTAKDSVADHRTPAEIGVKDYNPNGIEKAADIGNKDDDPKRFEPVRDAMVGKTHCDPKRSDPLTTSKTSVNAVDLKGVGTYNPNDIEKAVWHKADDKNADHRAPADIGGSVKPKSKFITIQVDSDDPETAKVVFNNAFPEGGENNTVLALVSALAKAASDTIGGDKNDEEYIADAIISMLLRFTTRSLLDLIRDIR